MIKSFPTMFVGLGEKGKGSYELYLQAVNEKIPFQLSVLERLLSERPEKKWSIGDKPVYGEVYLFSYIYQISLCHSDILKKFPLLENWFNSLKENEKVKEVLEKKSKYGNIIPYYRAADDEEKKLE